MTIIIKSCCDVVAAEKFATGCTTLRPTDLAIHYRYSRRTVVIESLKFNYLWGYFINDAATRPQIEEAVENIADSCDWCDARKTNIEDYPPVQPPTHWRTGWVGGKIQRNPLFDQFLDEPESDGELDEMFGLVGVLVGLDLSDSEEEEGFDQATTSKGNRGNYVEHSQHTNRKRAIRAAKARGSIIDPGIFLKTSTCKSPFLKAT